MSFKRGDIIVNNDGVNPIVLITNAKARTGVLLPINVSDSLNRYVNVETKWSSFSPHKWKKANKLKLALSGVTSQEIDKFLEEYQ